MAYTCLQMFMGNLKHLIDGNYRDPLINNNPKILSERPQFQQLYQELASIIQTLSDIHQHHLDDLEKVRNLKKRLKDAAEEAQDIIDVFLSTLHLRNNGLSPRSDIFKTALDLENVMRSIDSIKGEFMTINIHNMNMDSSPRTDTIKTQSSAAGRSHSGTRKPLEEFVVGLDRDSEIIRDKLTQDTKQLRVVSIVGMGGLGKTTLATKVFNDSFIAYHFHVRAWVIVSQTYKKRDFLIQILTSMGVQQDLEKDNDSKLREKLHKNLMGRRYLIVIDDIWSVEVWDDLISFFPHENTRSRVLLTSRLNEVALHAKPHGFVHSLRHLTEKQSWELLKQKVFHGDECPEWSIKPGTQIAKKCQGLPLSVVVIAGVLTKESMNEDLWEYIACSASSYIVSDQKGSLETLALSYHHLPDHLRECFLYLGGFPEDIRFNVERLIWLWVAEGFIQEVENQSLEDTAKAYLIELINRNLVVVAKRNSVGDVKACKIHDLVGELCLQKAKEERFFLKIDSPSLSSKLSEVIKGKPRHVFTNEDISIVNFTLFPTQTIRSLLWFHKDMHSIKVIARSFVLLKVLDLQNCKLDVFPHELALLVHLRYLAIYYSKVLPNSICKLWSLQTLILKLISFRDMRLPGNITDLVNLRHLWSNRMLYLPYIGKAMNLQSITNVVFGDGVDNFGKCFPKIKKLEYTFFSGGEQRFELPPYLEALKLTVMHHNRNIIGNEPTFHHNSIWFPATLKKLTLKRCCLPWSDMSIINTLPNLEVLKLKYKSFLGTHWNAGEQQFRQLKLLALDGLFITHWEASSTSFPCLKQLSLLYCMVLEGIPLEIGEIATLELIEINTLRINFAVESVKRIQQEQHDVGNDKLKITINRKELSFYLSQQYESSESE